MFCPKCRKGVEEGSIFCPECGGKLDSGREVIISKIRTISSLRHPKESTYFIVAAIASGLLWIVLIWIVVLFIWIAIPTLIMMWLTDQFFKAQLLGNSVKVSEGQYPEIYEILEKHCRKLNINKSPEVFLVNSEGAVNALAIKWLKRKYVILYSGLTDIMLSHNSLTELSSVIGHEIGHHAAGHTAVWKRILLAPAMFIPFLGPAYFRACELTADRIGMYLCGDKDAASRSLITLACGSYVLAPKTKISEFKEQERFLSPLFAFLNDLWATHPRITKRVIALEESQVLK